MDEGRDQPAAGSRKRISAGAGPPATQQARNAYVTHTTGCRVCRDIDRDRCSTGEELWRAWNTACDAAFRQLANDMP